MTSQSNEKNLQRTAGFEDKERGPRASESRQPLETGKSKETFSLKPPEGNTIVKTFILAIKTHVRLLTNITIKMIICIFSSP